MPRSTKSIRVKYLLVLLAAITACVSMGLALWTPRVALATGAGGGKIEQLRQAYEEMKRAEMQSWLDMGNELISTADLLPDVKGHGNMKPIKSAKLTILLRAKSAYQQAYRLGCSEALSKIRMAEDRYSIAANR